MSGGFVATQVQASSYPSGFRAEDAAEVRAHTRPAPEPPIIAHSFEFVALPGRAEGVQSEIPTAMRHGFRDTDGFVGSLVLVSEQEARLVTVITLWGGSHRSELCRESEKRLKRWLAPFVDRWLRTRRCASFVTAPGQFLTSPHSRTEAPVQKTARPLQ